MLKRSGCVIAVRFFGHRYSTATTSVLPKETKVDPLTDSFGRRHTYLRISLTERCNLRCVTAPPLITSLTSKLSHPFGVGGGTAASLSTRRYSNHLSHVDDRGKASMVDIIHKAVTVRTATAVATVKVGPKITKLISENGVKKGDVLSIAQISGILGAKKTSEIIPLCHNIPLTRIVVTAALDVDSEEVKLFSDIQCEGRTGVEMEALTAVSVAALTIYDMCKAVSRDIVITDVYLTSKTGGRSGDYVKEAVEVRQYDHRPITRLAPYVGPV